MVPDEPTQRINLNQRKTLEGLRGELGEFSLEDQKQRLVKRFYEEILKRKRIGLLKIDYSQLSISDDGQIFF